MTFRAEAVELILEVQVGVLDLSNQLIVSLDHANTHLSLLFGLLGFSSFFRGLNIAIHGVISRHSRIQTVLHLSQCIFLLARLLLLPLLLACSLFKLTILIARLIRLGVTTRLFL